MVEGKQFIETITELWSASYRLEWKYKHMSQPTIYEVFLFVITNETCHIFVLFDCFTCNFVFCFVFIYGALEVSGNSPGSSSLKEYWTVTFMNRQQQKSYQHIDHLDTWRGQTCQTLYAITLPLSFTQNTCTYTTIETQSKCTLHCIYNYTNTIAVLFELQ